jgi:hypothetical protein
MFPIKPIPEINNSEKRAPESRQQNASQKLIASVFSKIVFLWPADSRDWALAMQAELPQMESTQESLRWLAGGIMSLGKAWWNSGLTSDNRKDLAPVKKPGILAALVTVTALALLLIPSANQGLRSVLTSWESNHEAAEETRFMQIARDAESRGDAKTMAFAAMRIWSRKDFVSFANKAVTLDPSLTWIFAQGSFNITNVPESRDWPAKLAAYDQGNSVAYLVQAQIRSSELSHNGMITASDLKSDPQWLDAGRKALESPRYDSYHNRRLALDRDVIVALGIKDARVIGLTSLRTGFVSLWSAEVYSKQLMAEAKLAIQRGDKETAKRDAWAVAHFGEIVRAHGETEMERRWATNFMRPSYAMLQPLLAAEGRHDESAMLTQSLEAMRPGAPAAAVNMWPESAFTVVKTTSIAMHLAAAVAIFFGAILLLSGFWLLAEKFILQLSTGLLHRIACRSARFAPTGMFVSLALLAFSYLPTAGAVDAYLTRPISNSTLMNLTDTYYSVYWLPDTIRMSPGVRYHPMFWMIFMAFGVLTIATIIGRNILNRTMRLKAA